MLDGKTIGGGGNITVNELNGDAACVLVNITTSGTTIVNNAASEDTTFTGSFPNTAFTLDGSGTVIMSIVVYKPVLVRLLQLIQVLHLNRML